MVPNIKEKKEKKKPQTGWTKKKKSKKKKKKKTQGLATCAATPNPLSSRVAT
jgi:hypothetical protein